MTAARAPAASCRRWEPPGRHKVLGYSAAGSPARRLNPVVNRFLLAFRVPYNEAPALGRLVGIHLLHRSASASGDRWLVPFLRQRYLPDLSPGSHVIISLPIIAQCRTGTQRRRLLSLRLIMIPELSPESVRASADLKRNCLAKYLYSALGQLEAIDSGFYWRGEIEYERGLARTGHVLG